MGPHWTLLHQLLSWSGYRPGKCSTSRPNRYTPEKKLRYPFKKRLGGPQSQDSNPGSSSPVA